MNYCKFRRKQIITIAVLALAMLCIFYYPQYKDGVKWKKYFARTNIEKPNDLVAKTINTKIYQNSSNIVILDLGAGNGNDTSYLLNQGFKVFAVDFHDTALERIMRRSDILSREHLTLIKSSFQNIEWDGLPKFDAVVAINSISFVNLKEFKFIWHKIAIQIKPGGLFICRLFGNKLDWPNMQNMTLLSKQELFDLADGFTIVSFEEEYYQQDNFGQHAFSIILKK